jgi:hypothetical protein
MTQEEQSYEVEEMVSALEKFENKLYALKCEGIDEGLFDQLTDEQRDRFSNNLANYAMELMDLAMAIDHEVALLYQ